MEDKQTFGVLISPEGQQVTFTAPEGVMVSMSSDSGHAEMTLLDVTETEFNDLKTMAKTNSIPDDTIKTKAITD